MGNETLNRFEMGIEEVKTTKGLFLVWQKYCQWTISTAWVASFTFFGLLAPPGCDKALTLSANQQPVQRANQIPLLSESTPNLPYYQIFVTARL